MTENTPQPPRSYITKRQLGLGLALLGLAAILVPFVRDWLGGSYAGIGPAQRLILIAGGLVFLLGVSLVPLGDRPA